MARRKDKTVGEKIDSKERKVEKSKRIKHTTWAHEDNTWNVMCARHTYDLSHACACHSMCNTEKMWRVRCAVHSILILNSSSLWFCCDSFFTCIFWFSFRHYFRTICRTEMDDVKQTQKMIPLITCEISLCQYVYELVLGVNVFDLDLGVQIDSIQQPMKSNSVGSGNMSHCKTSSLYDHLDHRFVVFKDVPQSFLPRRNHVWGNKINIVLNHQSFHEFSFALEIYTSLPVLDHSDACFREEL